MRGVFEAANQLVAEGVITSYAIGGAIGASFYLEAGATEDVDIFFHAASPRPFQELAPIYEHLQAKGFPLKREFVVIDDWDVQFLMAADGSIESEAVQAANTMQAFGVDVRVMMPEYLCAIAVKTGRDKDIARVRAFIEQEKVDLDELKVLIDKFHLDEAWKRIADRQ